MIKYDGEEHLPFAINYDQINQNFDSFSFRPIVVQRVD